MRKITIHFTPDEIVKLISCCNAAIVQHEEVIRTNGNIPFGNTNLKESTEKIWEVKTLLKNAILKHCSSNPADTDDIPVHMVITETIKLNGCCNSVITNNEKLIDCLPRSSTVANRCYDENRTIEEIRLKMKRAVLAAYNDVV